MSASPKVTIGIVSFKDKTYLEQNLPELLAQNYPNFEIIIFDNNSDTVIRDWLKEKFSQIKVFGKGENIGFGKAHNFLIDKAVENQSEFYLGFNSDMLPYKNFIRELVHCACKNSNIGCVTGKLLQWKEFPHAPNINNPQRIDTVGLTIFQNHKVIDRGQGEKDQSQFNEEEEIWGASGAAPFFLIKALKDIIHSPGEYFDKDFFIYKEDVDLAYRLHWAGWKTIYTPKAIAWHNRTTEAAGNILQTIKKRKARSRIVKEQSFLNQMLLVYKNWSSEYSWKTKIKTMFFLYEYIFYAIFFEVYLLKQLKNYSKLRPVMKIKRTNMPRRISAKEMEKWFR